MTSYDRHRIAGVVLAGGLSRRMGGGDKGLAGLGAATMLDEVIRRLAPQVGCLLLSANGDPARFARFGLPVAADTIAGSVGPLAGVLAACRWVSAEIPTASHVLSVPSDTPFLPGDVAGRLLQSLVDRPAARIALASSGGELHPVVGLWPLALADDLDAALRSGLRKVQAWADRHGIAAADFPMHATSAGPVDPFFNANSPEQLDEARRLLPLIPP